MEHRFGADEDLRVTQVLVVAITGDIHAFFAGTPSVIGDPSRKIVEFVTSSISSTTFQRILQNQVETDPVLVCDPLDINSNIVAPARQLADTSCLSGSSGIKD